VDQVSWEAKEAISLPLAPLVIWDFSSRESACITEMDDTEVDAAEVAGRVEAAQSIMARSWLIG